MRTPYGKPASGFEPFVRAGYAVVAQDSRGRYASEGKYVPFTVERTQDGEDGYDSVEWLAAQPYCNGKVGTFGVSYNGWMQWSLARLRPPHLVAMCANSIPLEITDLDWWGSFRPGRRVKWWITNIAPDLRRRHGLPPPHTPEEAEKIWEEQEQMRWIWFLPWMDLPRYLPPGLREYARDWLRNSARRCWRFDRIHREVEVPNLDFSGWYDHCNGSMRHLQLMQKHARTKAAREQSRLVIGPWNHKHLGERALGSMDYGPEAQVDLTQVMIRWFDHWLKGDGEGLMKGAAGALLRHGIEGVERGRDLASGGWHRLARVLSGQRGRRTPPGRLRAAVGGGFHAARRRRLRLRSPRSGADALEPGDVHATLRPVRPLPSPGHPGLSDRSPGAGGGGGRLPRGRPLRVHLGPGTRTSSRGWWTNIPTAGPWTSVTAWSAPGTGFPWDREGSG